MESLVSAIVWFGNTVVICILAVVIYCMFNRTDGSNERSKWYGVCWNHNVVNWINNWILHDSAFGDVVKKCIGIKDFTKKNWG